MKARPYPSWVTWAFIVMVGLLAFTGMIQMPLANRYYLTSVPGMAWTGDFFFVHKLHYVLASLFLFFCAVMSVNWLLEWRNRLDLTAMGKIRLWMIAGIVASGGMRVYRNLPDVNMDPTLVLVVEWVHFGLVMLLGVVALTAVIRKSSQYVRWK
ncbi:conserved membrane protein of unknown function [Pseudodesulfovibrio profundus]|uniref:FeS-binding protein n=1 Tax=Pseudodesulfovibrio profundus TaxID=57320 RepID=A0A2C8FCL7_9BACT|nr:4Fe-4S ferredoxin [Pseudodesulfovibrio profundus]SOB60191.1 conserved membrane protein of unknown function [Pseudodesulfovibrio profundus]